MNAVRPRASRRLWLQRALLFGTTAVVGLLVVEAVAWTLMGPPHAGHHRIFCR